MVWIDSDDNPYRVHVLPMAYRNPAIGMAMAAVSSQHASTFNVELPFPEKARDEAVEMILSYVKQIMSHLTSGRELAHKLDESSVVWVLAAMLILSCYEMTNSGAVAANYHRRAARSLVNTFETTGQRGSPLFNFLKNQLSLHDVFACTTSFDLSTMEHVILPPAGDDFILFSTYMRYLHDVTLLSRTLPAPQAQCPRMGLTFDYIESRFELARGETLMTAGRLYLHPAHRRQDFIRLVAIYHYAALLYSGRCLELGIESQAPRLSAALLDTVTKIHSLDEWEHLLAWPLFVAGVESYRERYRHTVLIDLYTRISEKMRFKNFRHALHFLQEFWKGDKQDWRVVANKWEAMGQPVYFV